MACSTEQRYLHGKLTRNYAKTSPCFPSSDDGFQVNLVSRLQILDAFEPSRGNTKLHRLARRIRGNLTTETRSMKGIRHSPRRLGVHPSGVSDHDKFPSHFHLLRAFVPPW
jgi:hypothetical protein